MTEQIGLAVASEPRRWTDDDIAFVVATSTTDDGRIVPSVIRSMMRQMRDDLLATEWFDLAEAQSAELKRLRAENTELRAKLEDLHEKYVAAQSELHELRIRNGLKVQP